MSKKLTKTIILIVFVVFLGINKVNADVYKTCKYEDDDRKSTIIVGISDSSDDYETLEVTAYGKLADAKINAYRNWTKEKASEEYKKRSTFFGKNYFTANGNVCPPLLIYARFGYTEAIYFARNGLINEDEGVSYYDNVKNGAKGDEDYRSEFTKFTLTASGEGTDPNGITSKVCSSYATVDGTGYSINMTVSGDAIKPTVDVISSKETRNTSLTNWSISFGDSNYTYRDDLMANNSCPDYLLLVSSDDTKLVYASDSASLDLITEGLKKSYPKNNVKAIKCSINDSSVTSPEVNANVGLLVSDNRTYSCGGRTGDFIVGIPAVVLKITKLVYNFIQVLVPVSLILLGIIDLLKAISSQKEDEIKKGQSTLIKRLIGAVMVFFVFAIIKFVVSVVAKDADDNIIPCINCFLTGDGCVEEPGV